jgi:hypothetical protein
MNVAVYCPELATVIGELLMQLLQVTPAAGTEVNTTSSPSQKLLTPEELLICGSAGNGLTVTLTGADHGETQP